MGIVILGAEGQLGQDFRRLLAGSAIALGREALDLTNALKMRETLTAIQPSLVINCAAYTLVDRAEQDAQAAFAINAWSVRDLALLCRDLDCTLVHFSTNYVFGMDKDRDSPYAETDVPGPLSVYGNSKLTGEYFVRSICPKHFVLRTSGLYGRGGSATRRSNFVETMLRKGAEGKPLRLVHDQICTPTATLDLVRAVLPLLRSSCFGLYHLTNADACTWFEFAREIFRLARCTAALTPISTLEYPTPAQRPLYSVLDNASWRKQGLSPLRHWREALEEYLFERSRAQAA